MARLGRSRPIQTQVLRRTGAGVAAPKTETLTDDFATDDTVKWPLANRYGTTTITGGRAVMPERVQAYSGMYSPIIYDLNNSYVYAKVTPPAVYYPSTEVSLDVLDAAGTSGLWTVIYVAGGLPYLLFRQKIAGVNNDQGGLAYDPVAHAYWRMRLSGGNVYWDTSPDGTTWTNRRTLASTLNLPTAAIEMSVGQYAIEATQGIGYFDNLNVVPAGQALTYSTTDNFGLADSVSIVKDATYTATDALGLTDARTSNTVLARVDTEGLTDVAANALATSRTDSLGLTDDAVPVLEIGSQALTTSATDDVGLTDSVSVVIGRPKAEVLTDTFDTQVDPAVWTLSGTGGWDAGRASLTELNGGYSYYSSVNTYDLTDSSVYARIIPSATPAASTEMYLAFKVPGLDNNGLYASIWQDSGLNKYYVSYRERRGFNGNSVRESTAVYDPVNHAYFRLRSVGQNVYWDTSPDGTTWTQRKTLLTTLDLTGSKIEMWAGQFTSQGTQATHYFDNINTVPPPQSLTQPATDTLGLTDSVSIVKDATYTASDTLGLVDARTSNTALARTDTLGLTDTVALSVVLARTDVEGLTDVATTVQSSAYAATDSVGLTDSVSTVITRPKIETLTDDFPGTTLDTTKWTEGLWDATTNTLVNNRAQLKLTSGYTNLGVLAGKYGVAESSVFAQVILPANLLDREVGMYCYLTTTPNRVTMFWSGGGTTGSLLFRVAVAGTTVFAPSGITYDPVAHAWWKISFSGSDIFWHTSPDGFTWTQRSTYSTTALNLSNVLFRFEAGTSVGDSGVSTAYIDNVNVPGVAGQSLTLDRSDTLGLTDAQTVAATTARADTETLTDSVATAWSTSLARTDTESLTDTATTALAAVTSAVDPLGLTDSVALSLAVTYSTTDTLGLTDARTADVTLARSDTEGLADALATARDIPVTLTDSLGLADPETAAVGLVRSDTQALTDAASSQSISYLTFSDSTGMSDGITSQKSGAGTFDQADTLGLTDTDYAATTTPRTDPLGITDSVNISLLTATKTDPLGLSDTWAMAEALARADGLNLSDSVTITTTVAWALSLTDNIGLTDSFTWSKAGAGVSSFTDLLGLSDSWTLSATRILTEPLGLLDIRELILSKPLLDTAALTDSLLRSTGTVRSDLTGMTDSFTTRILALTGGRPKAYTGTDFEPKPGKVWTGTEWVEKPWKTWTGTEWETVT